MRKSMLLLAALFVVSAVVPAEAAKSPQKPGKWSIKMEMEVPGMPVKLPPVTWEACITKEDLENPEKAVPGDPKQQQDCTISDTKIDGNTVTWTVECPKQDMKGEGKITYSNDSYAGEMHMTVGEQTMKTKYSGKWLGECEK